MNKKIFLVIFILILTIVNLILFKNFYNEKTSNNEVKEISDNKSNIIIEEY